MAANTLAKQKAIIATIKTAKTVADFFDNLSPKIFLIKYRYQFYLNIIIKIVKP